MLGDRIQVFEIDDQQRSVTVKVRFELIHHQFFDVFAHGFGLSPRVYD